MKDNFQSLKKQQDHVFLCHFKFRDVLDQDEMERVE